VSVCALLALILRKLSIPKKTVEHLGREAAAFTRRIVEGKRVRVEFDPANASQGHKDNTRQIMTCFLFDLSGGQFPGLASDKPRPAH
jgi:endonuclease YncB( thermonuclease family)